MGSLHPQLNILLLIVHLCSIHASAGVIVLCLPDEASTLLQLKRSFHNSNLTSWQDGTDCCRWEGVICDTASGRVIALDLAERKLQSQGLYPAIFRITSLRNLSLAHNDFSRASLPSPGFERLTEMVHLDLANTNFFGQIPIGIGHLEKLVMLDLSTVYEDDPFIPFGLYLQEPSFQALIANLSSLRELHLDGVDISSSGPAWSIALANFTPRLQILSLSSCGLSGSIHHLFSELGSLVKIDLMGNRIVGVVPEFFADFPLLSTLALSSNNFQGKFPPKIFQLKNMRVLMVSSNPKLSGHLPKFPVENNLEMLDLLQTNFSDDIPVSIVNLKSLIYLRLSTEGISKQLPFIAKLTSLDFLELQGSGLQKPHFSWIGDLRNLTSLSIENYNFSETIPSWIGNLKTLTSLWLKSCNFYGPIPSLIGNLTQLSSLDFEKNYLTGKIPEYLFTLPALQALYLSSNQLSGQLEDIHNPLSSSLSIIGLGDNQIMGSIPRSYIHLASLEILYLESNKLTGIVKLSSFWRLKNLRILSLSNNMLSVIDGKEESLFSSLRNIKTLSLASCNLTILPTVLAFLDEIETLDLSSNHINGVIPTWAWENWKSSLIVLNLSHNMFTSLEKFPSLIPMANVQYLDLSFNRLEGNVPLPFVDIRSGGTLMSELGIALDYSNIYFDSILPNFDEYLGKVSYLDLSKNKLNGHVQSSICRAKKLIFMDLSYNNFSGSVPSCLIGSGNLNILKLRENQFQGMLPEDIKQGCRLQTIDLNGNQIEGTVPRSLSNCQDLELLDVGNNHIVGSFPTWLGVLPELRVLVLRSNQFNGTIWDMKGGHSNINYFISLQILDLASNNFSGNLPDDGWFTKLKAMMANVNDQGQVLGHQTNTPNGFYRDTITVTFKGFELIFTKILTAFCTIDFSNNSFDGPVPESIGRLVSLHGLNMSYNNFTGQIPYQFSKLTQLESLDLSWNQLSGGIPQALTSLTSLELLNVSCNSLSGRIPQGHQFFTFSNSSFDGNMGLCGLPLSRQCDTPDSTAPTAEPPPESNSLCEEKLGVILLFAFVGLGFGVGFALSFLVQVFCRMEGSVGKPG